MTALLTVDELSVWSGSRALVDKVSFELGSDSRTGLIGESGSGKSLTALAIMGLLPEGLRATGSVRLYDTELLGMTERQLVRIRGNDIAMIFQEPMTALNPLHRVGAQVAESLQIHQQMDARLARDRAVELLEEVGIDHPERRARAFPHQLSGGQRQRVMIAAALACSPDLVIADEPTTALDVTVQQQVLTLLADEADRNDASLLLITHDLPVVSNTTESVLVMREGEIVERGPTAETFGHPTHDYTRALVDAVPPMSRGEAGLDTSLHPPSRRDSSEHEPSLPRSGAENAAGDEATEREGSGAHEGDGYVSVRGVDKIYRLPRTRLFGQRPTLAALKGVSLDIERGETFGIVGESGSGKSTLARVMMGLTPLDAGGVTVAGIDVGDRHRSADLRRTVQMVFQDPNGSLDPRMKVSDIIAEPLRSLKIDGDHSARVEELLGAVRLDADAASRYPHEFSGGQRQRIAIARALAPNPRVVIADEAVSALDMSVQTIILDLLADLKVEFDLTLVFISHDLSVVAEISDRVAVLEKGVVVETGPASVVLSNPTQPYTQRLVSAVPRMVAASA